MEQSLDLRNCRKEAAEDLKVFTEDMDLLAFLAAAETYINKSAGMEAEIGCLRSWMLSNTFTFRKYYPEAITKEFWKNISEKIGIMLITRLDEIKKSAGYVLKEITDKPELCWYKIDPDKADAVAAEIEETFGGRCSSEKTVGGGLKITFDNDEDWEEAKNIYPMATPLIRKSEPHWVLEE